MFRPLEGYPENFRTIHKYNVYGQNFGKMSIDEDAAVSYQFRTVFFFVVFEEEEPERIGTMTTNWEVSLVKMNKQFTYTFNGSKIF